LRNDRQQAVWPAVVLAAAAWWYFPAGARRGSNLFHYRVIIVILGHFAGFLAPHWAIDCRSHRGDRRMVLGKA